MGEYWLFDETSNYLSYSARFPFETPMCKTVKKNYEISKEAVPIDFYREFGKDYNLKFKLFWWEKVYKAKIMHLSKGNIILHVNFVELSLVYKLH